MPLGVFAEDHRVCRKLFVVEARRRSAPAFVAIMMECCLRGELFNGRDDCDPSHTRLNIT